MSVALYFITGVMVGAFAYSQYSKPARQRIEQKLVSSPRHIAILLHEKEEKAQLAVQRKAYYEEIDVKNTRNQFRFISECDLYAERPVNSEAVRVLYAVEDWLKANSPAWRVAFEVSMGAFIKTGHHPDRSLQQLAFSSYNSKRVDFLLIDACGNPRLAVEYNGTGHDASPDASDRMFVKRLALKKAKIPMIEVPAKAERYLVHQMIGQALGDAAS